MYNNKNVNNIPRNINKLYEVEDNIKSKKDVTEKIPDYNSVLDLLNIFTNNFMFDIVQHTDS